MPSPRESQEQESFVHSPGLCRYLSTSLFGENHSNLPLAPRSAEAGPSRSLEYLHIPPINIQKRVSRKSCYAPLALLASEAGPSLLFLRCLLHYSRTSSSVFQ